ncbi:MAG: ethanolamine utilization protein EutH, partial [Bacteroidota bacterium]
NDMGGYPLAMELAQNEQAGLLSGLIVSSMMGCTLVFSIPVGLGLIEFKDRPFFAKGLLIGLITVPIGGIAGGLIAGFDPVMVLVNNIPVLLLAVFFVIGLTFFSKQMIKGALLFGKLIVVVITIGLAASAFQELTGVVIIPGMAPIMDAMEIVAMIAIVLLGTFPVVTVITKFLNKPLTSIGKKLGMDATSAAGIVITLANSIPVYKMFKDMDPKGKVINTAWLVPATAALGDHLGFTAAVEPEMIKPVVLGKLIAGIFAIGIAMWFSRDLKNEIEQSRKMKKSPILGL